MKMRLKVRLSAMLLSLPVSLAWADAIDGSWCHGTDGKRMSINGSRIVTPGGAAIDGDYHRHFFSYVVPQDEPLGGGTVTMTLLDENTVRLRLPARGMGSSDEQVWLRCGPPVSNRSDATRLLG